MLCPLSYECDAEAAGFEPAVPLGTPVFETGAFGRSATPPWSTTVPYAPER